MSTTISQTLLPEFDQEFANARKMLERVPEDRPDFRPHPKSMTLAELAGHVGEVPLWAVKTLEGDEFETKPASGPAYAPIIMTSRSSLLAGFDDMVSQARGLLVATTDEAMTRTWSLKSGGKAVLAMPKATVMRLFVMNHLVHHRAQLGVYLRMNDVPVPGMYGLSADEGSF